MRIHGKNVETYHLQTVDAATPGADLGGPGQWLAPGFFDVQVNGFAGVDFNFAGVTTDDYRRAVQRMWATGATRVLPTVITGSRDRIVACMKAACRAASDAEIGPAMAGIHLEGPYISPDDGPRGAHPREHVRPPDRDEFLRFQDAAGGAIRLVTVAPEIEGAIAFIEWLRALDLVVAIGHTAADEAVIREAIRAGASLSTHLGNGAHTMIHRHRNHLWPQLAADELSASFIVDGHHLPPAAVKTFVRAKGVERSVLVTDAVAPAGSAPGHYEVGDVEIEMTAAGRVQIRGTDRLAGSALEMHNAVAKTVRFVGVSLAEAVQMAAANPAAVMGLPPRGDDHVLFDWDEAAGRITVRATVCAGRLVYSA
jgi:N-acetylglucosamine-6-phosphate deacetylase